MRNHILTFAAPSLMLLQAGCSLFEKSQLEYISWSGDFDATTETPAGFRVTPREATRWLAPSKTGYSLYHDRDNYYALRGSGPHKNLTRVRQEATIVNGQTGRVYDREAKSWTSPHFDRANVFVMEYENAVPRRTTFVDLRQTKYLGRPNGFPVLYYALIQRVAPDRYRGVDKLVVFDRKEQYLGTYVLNRPLSSLDFKVDGTVLTINSECGRKVQLDFKHGPTATNAPFVGDFLNEGR